jgi:hypothetical protein
VNRHAAQNDLERDASNPNRLALTVQIESDLHAAYARAAAFLDPILAGHTRNGRWDPQHRKWS